MLASAYIYTYKCVTEDAETWNACLGILGAPKVQTFGFSFQITLDVDTLKCEKQDLLLNWC